ncbi:MAG TPA: hypothetical protein VHB77_19025, partial [Planctomycetaceae bacterium]|nr:hypothetical protein [Planctomycetaceae bacterium]
GDWIRRVLELRGENTTAPFAAMQLARRTGDRYRDIPDPLREELLRWMQRENAETHFLQLVRDGGSLDADEQGLVFGEALPKGLRIL